MIKDLLKGFLIVALLFLSTYALATNAKYYFFDGDLQELGEEQNLGAPTGDVRYERNINPETDSTYELGTSSLAWLRATSDEFCLTGDTCISSWTSGSMTALPDTQIYVGNGSNEATATSTITVLSSGNVGISTTSPAYTLDVYGDLRVDGTYYGVKDGMIEMDSLTGSTYTNLSQYVDNTQSAGILGSSGTIIDNGDGTVKISAGIGMIKTTDSEIGINYFFDWAETDIGISQDEVNYLYIDYNGGSPLIATTSVKSNISHTDEISLGQVWNDGSEIHELPGGVQLQDIPFRIHKRMANVDGFTRATGMVTSENGDRGLAFTAGTYWNGLTELTATASTSITFSTWYNDGAWQETTGQTTVSNTQYNDYGTGLETVLPNKYGVYWLYRHHDGDFHLIYGLGSYTLASAEDANIPSELPSLVSSFSILVAKIIVERDGTNFTQIDLPWVTTIGGSVVTDHGSLGGLLDDDHTQYIKDSEFTQNSGILVGTGAGTFAEETGATLRASIDVDVAGTDNSTDVTLAGQDYLVLSSQEITAGEIEPDDLAASDFGDFTCNGTTCVLDATNTNLTTLANVTTVGTIGTGTWQATDVGVAYGGTGVSTLTDGGVLVGAGASAIEALTVGTNGQLLVGSTGANPVFATMDCADSLTCTLGAGTLEIDVDDDFLKNDGDIGTGVFDFGGATSFEIPNGDPTIDTTGEIGIDDDSNQLQYYGTSTKRALTSEITKCIVIESLAAADDNMFFGSLAQANTVTSVWCQWSGTGTTPAEISLEDGSANAMTHVTPTCTEIGTPPTPQNVTAANALTARETLAFDVDNAVAPETDTYQLCVTYTVTPD